MPKDSSPDKLIPDNIVIGEFGVTTMTLTRWTKDAKLDFPPPIVINNHKYRSRKLLEEFKARLLRKAIAERNQPVADRAVAARAAKKAKREKAESVS